ncbi:hypothetical protein HMPREF2550_02665 [Corynebacterium sp. HMSC074A01]|nr:hypothetical protein HMPREF2550_02665 [Corynebacterium sp. HMSC074A01]
MNVSERVGLGAGVIAIVLSLLSVLLAISRGTGEVTVIAAAGTVAVIGAMCIYWSLSSGRNSKD